MWFADTAAGILDEDEDDPEFLESDLSAGQRDLIAAALLVSCRWAVDQLAMDERELTTRRQRGEPLDIESTSILAMLPPRFWDQFDLGFAQRFAQAMGVVVDRLLGAWREPGCVAEELCVSVLLRVAAFHLHSWGADVGTGWMSVLGEVIFEDLDWQDLYAGQPSLQHPEVTATLGVAPMSYHDWFVPFRDENSLE